MMDANASLDIIVTALALSAASGICGLVFQPGSITGQRTVTSLMVLSMICGLFGSVSSFFSAEILPQSLLRIVPWFSSGPSWIGLDSLSAFFLVPIFLIGGLGSVYGLGYWRQNEHRGNAK
jgi:formate hydrogenlyase subunit 3/multisubunit Na+/H+ antiporter MnhD subunit